MSGHWCSHRHSALPSTAAVPSPGCLAGVAPATVPWKHELAGYCAVLHSDFMRTDKLTVAHLLALGSAGRLPKVRRKLSARSAWMPGASGLGAISCERCASSGRNDASGFSASAATSASQRCSNRSSRTSDTLQCNTYALAQHRQCDCCRHDWIDTWIGMCCCHWECPIEILAPHRSLQATMQGMCSSTVLHSRAKNLCPSIMAYEPSLSGTHQAARACRHEVLLRRAVDAAVAAGRRKLGAVRRRRRRGGCKVDRVAGQPPHGVRTAGHACVWTECMQLMCGGLLSRLLHQRRCTADVCDAVPAADGAAVQDVGSAGAR